MTVLAMTVLADTPPNLSNEIGESWVKQSQLEPEYAPSERAEDGEWPTNGATPGVRRTRIAIW